MMTLHVTPIRAETPDDLPTKDPGTFTYDGTPEGIAHDNNRRATFASVAVKAYAAATGPGSEPVEQVMGDLLCDLMHLADCLGLDWSEVEGRAENHYDHELKGEL